MACVLGKGCKAEGHRMTGLLGKGSSMYGVKMRQVKVHS